MKAIRFDHHGEPIEVLAVAERPAPDPVDGEVRFRILASPVNPSDLLYVRVHYAGARARLPAPVEFEGNYTPFGAKICPGLRNPGGMP